MKRTLSLVLALVMVLGSFSSVFAAEATTPLTAGEFLQGVGVLRGNQNNDLKLEDDLKRRDSVILLSRLMDQEDEANAFPSEDLKFDDLGTDKTYPSPIAWAVAQGIVNGKSETKFDPNGDLEARDFATMLLRVLGHEVTGDAYTVALETAKELGLLEGLEVENETTITRGMMAVMTFNTLGTAMKDSTETLADKLGIEMPPAELSTDIEVTAVKAIANNKLEVKVKEEVTASVADFTIAKKGTTTAVEVKELVEESAKVFVLETEALTAGTAYVLTSNGKSLDFTGIAKVTSVPVVKNFTGEDTNIFTVEFSQSMDFESATNVANYKMSGNITVVKAELDATRKTVTLTTDAARRNVVYTITIQDVLNTDGVAVAKTTRTAVAREDRTAPRVTTLQVQNNGMLVITFVDDTGMNKEALEDIANYTINDLEILSAEALYNSSLYQYDRVVVKTATQTVGKQYSLVIENLTDDSVLKNALGKQTRNFRGHPADVAGPIVDVSTPVYAYNNNKVFVKFIDTNALDKASAEDISNYVIKDRQGNILNVLSAELANDKYPAGYNGGWGQEVELTTDPQVVLPQLETYRLEVKGVMDEFGNALKPISGTTYATYNFRADVVDTVPPHVTKVEFMEATKVRLTFNEPVLAAGVNNPTNFSLGTVLGHAISSRIVPGTSNQVVELTTHEMNNNGSYTVKFENISDRAGNVANGETASFIATSRELDITPAEISYIYAVNNKEVHIRLSEAVKEHPATIIIKPVDSSGNFVAGTPNPTDNELTFTNQGKVDGGLTLVYTTTGVLENANYKILKNNVPTETFKDLANNKSPELANILVEHKYTFNGLIAAPYVPEMSYVEQTGPKTVRIYFSDYVEAPATFVSEGLTFTRGAGTTNNVKFSNAWTFTTNNNIVAGKKYTIPVNGFKAPVSTIGVPADSFYGYYEDSVAPTLIGVEPVHNKQVKLTYDEAIQTSGTYRIYRINRVSGNDIKVDIYNGPASSFSLDRTNLFINLPQEINSATTYYVEPSTGSTDLAGNRELVSGVVLTLIGTDKPATSYITGVSIIDAKTIRVATSGKAVGSISNVWYGATDILASEAMVGTNANLHEAILKAPVLQGVNYTVQLADGTKYTFKGNTSDYGIRLTELNATDVKIDWAAFDGSLYNVEVLNENGTSLGTSSIDGTDTLNVSRTIETVTPPATPDRTKDVIIVTGLVNGTKYYVVLTNNLGTVVYAQLVTLEAPLAGAAADTLVVAGAKASLPGSLTVVDPTEALSTIVLPSTEGGADVTWAITSGGGTITAGTYTTPVRTAAAQTVVLTATITSGTASDTVTITVTVGDNVQTTPPAYDNATTM